MIQASDRLLATRYGRALFLAAVAENEEDRVLREIAEAHRLSTEPALGAFLRNPRVSSADKKKRLESALGGKASALTARFLGLLIDKKRFALLSLMAAGLTRFIAEKKNTARAVVRTARALPAEAAEVLRQRLKDFSGKTVELDVKEDPELIGGVVVRLGDWVLDGSLRGRLQRMKEALSDGN